MNKKNKLIIPINSSIPIFTESIFNNESIIQLKEVAKQISSVISNQQRIISSITPQIIEFSKIIEEQQKYRMDSFQSIAQKIQPLISSQSLFTSNFQNISKQVSDSLKAYKTIGAFNVFEKYRETFYEFGGDLNPDNFTDEEIENTIQNNKELIIEVNQAIVIAEKDNYSADATIDLIYTLFLNKITFIEKKTYAIIVFILGTLFFTYNLNSTYSTNKTLDKVVVPIIKETLDKTQENFNEIKNNNKLINKQSIDIQKTKSEIENSNKLIDELRKEFKEYKIEDSDKIESIILEMRKQDNKTNKYN
jgi:hypothetical protein